MELNYKNHTMIYLGDNWYKDTVTGKCYQIINDKVVASRQSYVYHAKKPYAEIVCTECGAKRVIKSQDKHNSTRCKECARRHRNDYRAKWMRKHREKQRKQKNNDPNNRIDK